MSPKLARTIIRVCDFMIGYHGHEIHEALVAVFIMIPTIIIFVWLFLVFC